MTPEVWSQIIAALVSLLLALLLPLAGVGVQLLLKKLHLEQNQAVQASVRSAIAFAEEQGAAYLRAKGEKLDPSQKLTAAVERVLVKVPGITRDEAATLVQSELPKVGLGAAGFLQSTANAIRE